MKPAWQCLVLGAFVSLTTVTAYCQERRLLTVAEAHEASDIVGAAVLPGKCGPDGSVYVRFFNGFVTAPSKLTADAKKITAFGLDRTQYSQHSHVWDFAPAENGGIYELIFYRNREGQESGYRLLTFDTDGTLVQDVRLDVPFEPSHIAVLGNRTFVIEGRKTTEQGGHTGEPAMAVVGANGQVLNMLRLEGDLKPPPDKRTTESRGSDESATKEREFVSGINLSTAMTGDDGNAYVLRQSPTGPLFAISADGTVRSISLPKYNDALIHTAVVAGGRVLLQYAKSESVGEDVSRKTDVGFYVVYDLTTMAKVAEYGLEPDSPIRNSIPVCYNLNELSFFRINAKRHPVLLIAKP